MVAVMDPKRKYTPRGGALEAWRSQDEEVLIEGAVRTGKSMVWIEKSLAACLIYPGCRILWLRKTRKSLNESIMQAFEDYSLTPELRNYVGMTNRGHRQHYIFPNGSMIVPCGLDTPDGLLSTQFDRAYIFQCEELTESAYEYVLGRLTGYATPYSQLGSDCNPQHPGHWLNRRFKKDNTRRIRSRHEDNPRWHDGTDWTPEGRKLIARLERMTGVRRERLFLGRWAGAEGAVYDSFDWDLHTIDAMPEGWQSWKKIRSIDVGFTNPFVCQWWAIDGDGRAYLYREYVVAGVTAKNHGEEIRRLSGDETYEYTVSDHDPEARAVLDECGISTISANKPVTVGIQAVSTRLEKAGDGRPRLYVLRSSLITNVPEGKPYGTLGEIEGYLWHPAKEGRAEKEEPIKENDHSMDAMRYAIMAIDKPLVPIFAFPEDEQDNSGAFDDWSDDV